MNKLLNTLKRPWLAAILLFCGLNLALQGYAALPDATTTLMAIGPGIPMGRTFTGWIAQAFVHQQQAPDIVLFGSSQMASATFSADAHFVQKALDYTTYRNCDLLSCELTKNLHHPVTVFNWALGGAMVSDSYMESIALLHGRLKPSLIVLGISPRDFIDNTLPAVGATEPFQFFSRFTYPKHLENHFFFQPLDKLAWLINKRLPLREMGLTLQLAITELDDNLAPPSAKLDETPNNFIRAILTGGIRVKPGFWRTPANMPPLFTDNTKEYLHRFQNPNPPLYASEKLFFQEFLSLMHTNNISVLVVGMPTLNANRVLLPPSFWSKWREFVATTCRSYDADWFDLTDSANFSRCDFLDNVHMNASGGTKFLNAVADHITSRTSLYLALSAKPNHLQIAIGKNPGGAGVSPALPCGQDTRAPE